MSQIKTKIESKSISWEPRRRFRVGSTCSHNFSTWVNLTGKNGEPGVSADWLLQIGNTQGATEEYVDGGDVNTLAVAEQYSDANRADVEVQLDDLEGDLLDHEKRIVDLENSSDGGSGSRTIVTELPADGIIIDGKKTYHIDSGVVIPALEGHTEGKDIEVICNPDVGDALAIDLTDFPLVQLQGGGFTESPANYYTLETQAGGGTLWQHLILMLWRRGNLFISNSANFIVDPGYVPPPENIEDFENVIAYWQEGEGDNTAGTATKTDVVGGKILSAASESNPNLSGTEWQFNGTNQGFRLIDAEINSLLNSDAKDFQIHYRGKFNANNTRLICGTKIGSSPNSLWNFLYNMGSNTAQLSVHNAAGIEIAATVLDPMKSLGTEYLISLKFHRSDLGSGVQNYIDVVLNDGSIITETINIDALNLNASEIEVFFIGMRETTAKQFYNVGWKSLVIANTSEYFDAIREKL